MIVSILLDSIRHVIIEPEWKKRKKNCERHAVNIFIPFFDYDVSLSEMEMSFCVINAEGG